MPSFEKLHLLRRDLAAVNNRQQQYSTCDAIKAVYVSLSSLGRYSVARVRHPKSPHTLIHFRPRILWIRDISVRHFGTSVKLSVHIGTTAEVSYGH